MVVGPVASGKLTMLRAILGELRLTFSTVTVTSKEIPYCDQSPWLRNATGRENIVGFSSFNQSLYYSVVRDCSLEAGLLQLPDGDQALVGSSGIILSGGQKEKLAIARAIYARKIIALFNDVMSGMDAKTSSPVFKSCFGKEGRPQRAQTIVVLETHAVEFLPMADHIISLSRSGEVVE